MVTTRSSLLKVAVALFWALFARETASFVISRAPRPSFLWPIARTASWRNGRIQRRPDDGKWETVATKKKYRQRQASSQRMTTTSMNVLQTRSDNVAAATHGGDFAGFMATFDLKGKLIPIQVGDESPSTGPKILEVLVSEGQEDTISSFRRKGGLFSWERKTSQVLPARNHQEGTMTVEHTNLTSSWVTRADDDDNDNDEEATISAAIPKGSSIRSILGLEQYPETSTPAPDPLTIETQTLCAATGVASDDGKGITDKFRIETTFSLPNNQRLRIMVPVSLPPEPNATSYSRGTWTDKKKKSGPQPLPLPPLLLEEPIVVVWEFRASRQVMLNDEDEDDGSVDLDPRRVQLAARNFASRPIIPWQPLSRDDDDEEDDDEDSDSSARSSACWDMVPPTMLILPGCNATVTFGYEQVQKEDDEEDDDDVNSEGSETNSKLEWFLEVGHYIPERNNIRQTVRRTFCHDGFARPPLYFDTMSLVEHFVEQGERPAPGKFRYAMGQ